MEDNTMVSIITKDAVKAAITSIQNRGKRFDKDVHKAAVQCMLHAEKHGDFTLADALYEAMPKSSRAKSLVKWFEHFAPMLHQKSTAEGMKGKLVFKKNKHKGAPKFDAEAANKTPFYDKFAEAVPVLVDDESVEKRIQSLIKFIEKAVEEHRVAGDENAVTAKLDALKAIA